MISKRTIQRAVVTAILAAGLVGAGAAATFSSLGTNTAQASAATHVTTASVANTRKGAGRGGFFGGGFGEFRGRGALVVTAVSGNTITGTSRNGSQVTVNVTSSTTYSLAGAPASLSDVKVGAAIAVQSATSTAGATTITATRIVIVLPQEAGVVSAVSSTSLTITGFNGATGTINLSSSTRYVKAGQSAQASDVTTGTSIVAAGTRNSDGSLSAAVITIELPRVAGQVSAVNGTSITLTARRNGETLPTVVTSSSTTYVNADGTSATAASVKTNSLIEAEGTLSSDGKTLTALRITILNTNGFGGRGFGFGGFGGASFQGLQGAAGLAASGQGFGFRAFGGGGFQEAQGAGTGAANI